MMNDRKVPKNILGNLGVSTQREYKSLKRKQLNNVIDSLDKFNLGCYWINGYDRYTQIRAKLLALRDQLSVKKWGR